MIMNKLAYMKLMKNTVSKLIAIGDRKATIEIAIAIFAIGVMP